LDFPSFTWNTRDDGNAILGLLNTESITPSCQACLGGTIYRETWQGGRCTVAADCNYATCMDVNKNKQRFFGYIEWKVT
jgi:hypothetical protein